MEYLFFDLDGTLVDSSQGIFNCFTATLRTLGIEPPNKQVLKSFIGPPLEMSLSTFVNPNLLTKALSIYRQHYADYGYQQAQVYPEIIYSLKSLKKEGYKLYIVTSKNQDMATKLLTELSLIHQFEAVFGAQESSYTKADVIKKALTNLTIRAEQALMIGDTHFDIEGAKAHRIKSLGVTWGFGSIKSLQASGADALVSSPLDIVKRLRSF